MISSVTAKRIGKGCQLSKLIRWVKGGKIKKKLVNLKSQQMNDVIKPISRGKCGFTNSHIREEENCYQKNQWTVHPFQGHKRED